jgi:hypothetical protein
LCSLWLIKYRGIRGLAMSFHYKNIFNFINWEEKFFDDDFFLLNSTTIYFGIRSGVKKKKNNYRKKINTFCLSASQTTVFLMTIYLFYSVCVYKSCDDGIIIVFHLENSFNFILRHHKFIFLWYTFICFFLIEAIPIYLIV